MVTCNEILVALLWWMVQFSMQHTYTTAYQYIYVYIYIYTYTYICMKMLLSQTTSDCQLSPIFVHMCLIPLCSTVRITDYLNFWIERKLAHICKPRCQLITVYVYVCLAATYTLALSLKLKCCRVCCCLHGHMSNSIMVVCIHANGILYTTLTHANIYLPTHTKVRVTE